MGLRVVLPLEAKGEAEKYPRRFRGLGAEFEARACDDDEEVLKLARDADAVITVGSIRPIPKAVIRGLERCRVISNTQIGYDSIDVAAATERGILVTNVPDYCVEEVSDHAMALILACSRRVIQLDRRVRQGKWGLSADGMEIQTHIWPSLSRLQLQTLGLLGLGKVARAVARKAKGFQLRTIAYDPYISQGTGAEAGVEMVSLERLFRESDFLSIHAALTPETKHIVGDEALRLMKPTACVINTARGPLIDEEALCQALKEGRVAMAALDVTEREPPDKDSPLRHMDNVITTGHSAFFSPISEATRWERAADEVARVIKGRWPQAVVNPAAKKEHVRRWGKMEEAC
ncbi:MAG: C-terminal binding protein [Chloroflexota bacterium]